MHGMITQCNAMQAELTNWLLHVVARQELAQTHSNHLLVDTAQQNDGTYACLFALCLN